MKKFISLILCVLMIASVAAFAVYADEAEPVEVAREKAQIVGQTKSNEKFVVFDFTVEGQAAQGNSTQDSGYHMWWGKSKRFDCAYDEANQATKLIYTGSDTNAWYFTTCIPSTLQFNSNEFKYVKVLYKTSETFDDDTHTSSFYFGLADYTPDFGGTAGYQGQWGPDFHAEWLDSEGDRAYYANNGEWNEMIVDMSYNAFWEDEDNSKGYISELRYDMTFGSTPEPNDYIEIKYIAILKSEEDALRFGILEDGTFGFRDIELPMTAEETTGAEESTATETAAAETKASEETTVSVGETTVADDPKSEKTTANDNTKAEKGCGGFIGTGAIALVAALGAGFVAKKKH